MKIRHILTLTSANSHYTVFPMRLQLSCLVHCIRGLSISSLRLLCCLSFCRFPTILPPKIALTERLLLVEFNNRYIIERAKRWDQPDPGLLGPFKCYVTQWGKWGCEGVKFSGKKRTKVYSSMSLALRGSG